MASILERVLMQEIDVNDLYLWLSEQSANIDQLNDCLEERCEFVPYFLNFLRDQTAHLLQGTRSANNTPAKTPTTAKLKKLTRFQYGTPGKRGDVQLSSTPLNVNTKPQQYQSSSAGGSTNRSSIKQSSISKNNSRDFTGRSQRSIKFNDSADYKSQGHSEGHSKPGKNKRTALEKRFTGAVSEEVNQSYSLASTDEFPPMGSADKNTNSKGKSRRRIMPTLITSENQVADSPIFTLSPIVQPKKTALESSISEGTALNNDSLIEQSDMESTQNMKNDHDRCDELSTVTPKKVASSLLCLDVIKADPSLITHQDSLNLLASIYVKCIEGFLIPNLTVELHFVTQLLTVRGTEVEIPSDSSKDVNEIPYFVTVHNAVHFAVTVLSSVSSILTYLDRGTLRLLMSNQRIDDFMPSFKSALSILHETVPYKALCDSLASPIGGVSFQADTDNRKNFPNERAFHQFKKQRDTFYEVLREWEENHLSPGWSMSDVLGDRIHQLVNHKTELINILHLVRLFQSQLVQMCKGDGSWQDKDENIELLSELKQTNPQKLKKLQERLVTPAFHGGPCPLPEFPGYQEFFRDFIAVACNPNFNQHLSDVLAAKILDHDDIQLFSVETMDKENEDIVIDAEDRENLLNSLLTAKLLAKFLGYLTFLPYFTQEVLPESIENTYLALRNRNSYPLDVLSRLESARTNHRIIITVPWVVDYLSMMDKGAAQVPYFQGVFQLLITLYRETSVNFNVTKNCTSLLILTVLGWLFELPAFPDGLLFRFTINAVLLRDDREGMGALEVADQRMLYSCCPYLSSMRSMLVEFAIGVRGMRSSVRKITPVAAELPHTSVTSMTDKHLQSQMEENFFHNQPLSLKKAVEFVADRVSSNQIKLYRRHGLCSMLSQIPAYVSELHADFLQTKDPDMKLDDLVEAVERAAVVLVQTGKELCLASAPSYCLERCQAILQLMLPEETPLQVWKTTTLICYRLALEKVKKWLSLHITTSMFKKELTLELERQCKIISKTGNSIFLSESSVIDSSSLQSTKDGQDAFTGSIDRDTEKILIKQRQHNSFLFESPIRALQQAAVLHNVTLGESPIRFNLSNINESSPNIFSLNHTREASPLRQVLGTPKSTPVSINPSNKSCMNLSKFDDNISSVLAARLTKMRSQVTTTANTKSVPNTVPAPVITGDNLILRPAVDLNNANDCSTKNSSQVNTYPIKEQGDERTASPNKKPSQKSSRSLNIPVANVAFERIKSKQAPDWWEKSEPPSEQQKQHVNSCTEPLIDLLEFLQDLMQSPGSLEVDRIFVLLDRLTDAMENGPKEVIDLMAKIVGQLIIELSIMLAITINKPSVLEEIFQKKLLSLFMLPVIATTLDFTNLFCPKYIYIMSENKLCISSFVFLIKLLLDNNIIKFSVVITAAEIACKGSDRDVAFIKMVASVFSGLLPLLSPSVLQGCKGMLASMIAMLHTKSQG